MASTVDFPEPPDLAPNSQYPPEPAAHYSQPAYSFNRTSANYPVEQDMSAVDNFNRSMPGSMDSMPSSTNGHPHPHNVATSPSNQPEMAPPQSAHQQQFPSPTIAQRPSIDDSQDLSGGMDSSKRKRSKVSRACDECRRKKVRCDAADDEANIKTCSNCARMGQTCEYSRIPMKRGPSKGYIKELSERVQQVESQMALGGPGYRQSFDGNVPIYPDSPEEVMSLKRNYSFPDGRANPFTQPHFTGRDRMPSAGGWSNPPGGAQQKPRDRFSIAVAPDQIPESSLANGPSPVNDAAPFRPFWARADVIEPPSKRQRLSKDMSLEVPEVDTARLDELMSSASQQLLISHDIDLVEMLAATPRKLQHALTLVLCMLSRTVKPENCFWQDYGDLEKYVWYESRDAQTRSPLENTAWLWLQIFMMVLAEQDVSRPDGTLGSLDAATLWTLAIDVGTTLTKQARTETYILQTYASLLGRLAHLGLGRPLPRWTAPELATLPLDSSVPFFRMISETIVLVDELENAPRRNSQLAGIVSSQVELLNALPVSRDPHFQRFRAQFGQFVEFYVLHHRYLYPSQQIEPPVSVVQSPPIDLNSSALDFNSPFAPALFTLTTIRLAEFTEAPDPDLVQHAYEALDRLEAQMQSIVNHLNPEPKFLDGYSVTYYIKVCLEVIRARKTERSAGATAQQTNGAPPATSSASTRNNSVNNNNNIADTSTMNEVTSSTGPPRLNNLRPSAGNADSLEDATGPTAAVTAAPPSTTTALLGSARQTDMASLPPSAYLNASTGGMSDKWVDTATGVVHAIQFDMLLKTGWKTVLARLWRGMSG